jgi:hypothetical protein
MLCKVMVPIGAVISPGLLIPCAAIAGHAGINLGLLLLRGLFNSLSLRFHHILGIRRAGKPHTGS